jgi:hypothetical protein
VNAIAAASARFPAMTPAAVEQVRALESQMREGPQAELHTAHLIHGGMYARTIHIPASAVLTGALITRATVLIVNGACSVFVGGETLELRGYHVIPASAGRKQAFIAHADTDLTMLFPTRATCVADAEAEFTDEAHLLLSRENPSGNSIIITGE